MMWLRTSFALMLAFVLGLTSQGFAVARGHAASPMGQMVICQGHGAVTVFVDADGQPIEYAHLCPDVPAVLGVVLSFEIAPPVQAVTLVVNHVERAQGAAGATLRAYFGRAPPFEPRAAA